MRALLRLAIEEDERLEVVGEAGDGPTAVREVAELAPDVVVLDLSMPGMDGLEVLQKLKARLARACVIVFSGFTAERMEAVAQAHGADHYMAKGEPLENLRELVRSCGTRKALAI